MLIVLAELVLIASIRKINYVVTLAITDVLMTCLCQLGQGHSTQISGQTQYLCEGMLSQQTLNKEDYPLSCEESFKGKNKNQLRALREKMKVLKEEGFP